MKKSFGIRFVLAAVIALAVGVTGCGDDDGNGGGSGGSGGSGGMGGSAGMGGMGGSAGMGGMGGSAGMGGMGGSAGMGGMGGMGGSAGMGGMGGMGGTPVSFATDIQPYFVANCGPCHIGGGNTSGVNLDTYNSLVDNTAPLVVAGDSSMGTLIPQMQEPHPAGSDHSVFIPILADWIDDGALDN